MMRAAVKSLTVRWLKVDHLTHILDFKGLGLSKLNTKQGSKNPLLLNSGTMSQLYCHSEAYYLVILRLSCLTFTLIFPQCILFFYILCAKFPKYHITLVTSSLFEPWIEPMSSLQTSLRLAENQDLVLISTFYYRTAA